MNKKANIFDLYSENFERYFEDLVTKMNDSQKKMLPVKLLTRLFTNKKNIGVNLEFREKVYILNLCFDKRITIVVEDHENGIGPDEYEKAILAQRGKVTNTELLSQPRTKCSFVMADKNLMNSMMYLNHVYTTEIYTLIRPLIYSERSNKDNKYHLGIESVKAITRLILNYEMLKKRLVMQFDFRMSDIYAILYFSGGERIGQEFFLKDFKYSYNANSRELADSLRKLHEHGFLDRRGRPLKYSLTAKGVDILNKIMQQIVVFYKTNI